MSAPNVDMLDAMRQIAELRGIPVQTLFEALANALETAYKRMPGAWENSWVDIDPDTGEYHIWAQELDENGAPMGEEFEVEKDEARELLVGVVDAASVRGKIVLFGDARGGLGPGDRGAGAEKEYKALGGFSAGLVELTNGREVLRQLTDSDGAVSFDNLRPGKWTLRVHKNNLPPHHLIETPETDLEVGPGQTREVFVRVLPVRRSIRFIDGGTISPVTSR